MGQDYEDEMRAKRQEAAQRAYRQDVEHDLAQRIRERDELVAQLARLRAFKTYVHARLDQAGVPTHPDGPRSKEGCRIGDRLDWLLNVRDGLLAACKTMRATMYSPTSEESRLADAAIAKAEAR